MPSNGSRGPIRAFIELFSSIRLAIVLISLIIIYSAVGSAVPNTRQFFELTEFAYFNHWAFALLIGLFALNLVVATVRRIPLNLRNAGVLTVHSGLLLLCAGSLFYFGRKVEGDVLLLAPRIQVLSSSRMQAGRDPLLDEFAIYEGKVWERSMPMLGGAYRIEVLRVEHKDLVTAARVVLNVSVDGKEPRVIELSQDDPHNVFTPLNEHLYLGIDPANVCDTFQDNEIPMLLVERDGRKARCELPALPYYRERFADAGEPIRDMMGQTLRPESGWLSWLSARLGHWRLPLPIRDAALDLLVDGQVKFEIDGYLPYAELEPAFIPGGESLRPVAKVTLNDGHGPRSAWLQADVPSLSSLETEHGASVEFRWLGDQLNIDPAWTAQLRGSHVLEVEVKDRGMRHQFNISQGATLQIPGTDYRLTVERIDARWPLMTPGFEQARTPAALIWVESPNQQFQRSVLQRFPKLNQDRDRSGKKLRDDGGLVDDNLVLRYWDASADRYMIFAGSDLAPTLVHTAPGGRRTVQVLSPGATYSAAADRSLALASLLDRPQESMQPMVVPARRRQPFNDVRRANSLIRVLLAKTDGSWSKRVWVPYSHYEDQSTRPPQPRVNVPGVGTLKLVYSRPSRPLGGKIALERLHTEFQPGRRLAREWTSYFRYVDPDDRQIYRSSVYLNHTKRIGPWTLYQANAANDHETFTGLGVGNRDGVFPMLLGCVMITLGMTYAFTIKPILVRRRRDRITAAQGGGPTDSGGDGNGDRAGAGRVSGRLAGVGSSAVAMLLLAAAPGLAQQGDAPALAKRGIDCAAELRAIEDRLDLKALGVIALEHGNRYSTVESWARDMIEAIHGAREPLFGLSPVAAAMELMLNAEPYLDENIIYVKDVGLRHHITAHPVPISESESRRILRTGMVSHRFLRSSEVGSILAKFESDTHMRQAMNRLANALGSFENLRDTFHVVPDPGAVPDEDGRWDAPWFPLQQLAANIGPNSRFRQRTDLRPLAGVGAEQAETVLTGYFNLIDGWRKRDVDRVNRAIADLSDHLPRLAPAGNYPSIANRRLELRYHQLDLTRWAWLVYIVALFLSLFHLGTGFRWPRPFVLLLLLGAICLHGWAIYMRWTAVGRIPVANMYEAVVSSTFAGAALAWFLEIFTRARVYGLAAAFLGFFALALPELNIISSTITTMMPILDDIMLRIHTVLIIASYAVITLAFAVANCYLVVSAFRDRSALAQGVLGAEVGIGLKILLVILAEKYGSLGIPRPDGAGRALVWDFFLAEPVTAGHARFFLYTALAGLAGALASVGAWSVLFRRPASAFDVSADVSSEMGNGDILKSFDLSHRVLLYIAAISLFVGLVLGAVWADYSWGRPWGWDPKEVFALNTWLIYAILIHVPFITRRRALWTSVLSVLGFAVMQFNWWVVNFYIVGLHSYA